MGLLARAVSEQKATDPLSVWAEMLRAGRKSKAGPDITLDSAFKVSVLFACLRVMSQGVAQVPFKLFRETEVDGLKKIVPAKEHHLYDLMSTKPNDWTTSFEFRETMALHAGLGNAYAFRNVIRGELKELILLNPGRVQCVQLPDWSVWYDVTGQDGTTNRLSADKIWHVRGPSWNGFTGMEVLTIAKDALGLSIALDDSVAGLHANGVRTSGTYSVDGNLDAEQHKKLLGWIKENAATPGAPMVLDRGAKWLQQAMTSVDAQHLEMRKHQIEEICRFTGVSPFMIFHTDKAPTYASAEQFQIQHVVHTLSPWYSRFEQSADAYLLTKAERTKGYYFKFNAAGLLRGAMRDQGEFFARMLGSGGTRQVMTQDEIRGLLELNPMGGDAAILHEPQGSQSSESKPKPA